MERPSHAHDPELHEPGSPGAEGRCTIHLDEAGAAPGCTGEAVVSFEDDEGRWQSGCSAALEQLVDSGEIDPLGQGA